MVDIGARESILRRGCGELKRLLRHPFAVELGAETGTVRCCGSSAIV
jgi:hypothetical protein